MDLRLETERLIIRPFQDGDLEDVHAMLGDPEVMRYIPSGPSRDLEHSRRRLSRLIELHETTGYSSWAVVDKATGRVIGDCGLFPVEGTGPEIEVAYQFRRSAWGKGYATEAARAVIEYGFNTLCLDRIVALVEPENAASQRVIEKSGLKPEGQGTYYNRELLKYGLSRN